MLWMPYFSVQQPFTLIKNTFKTRDELSLQQVAESFLNPTCPIFLLPKHGLRLEFTNKSYAFNCVSLFQVRSFCRLLALEGTCVRSVRFVPMGDQRLWRQIVLNDNSIQFIQFNSIHRITNLIQ